MKTKRGSIKTQAVPSFLWFAAPFRPPQKRTGQIFSLGAFDLEKLTILLKSATRTRTDRSGIQVCAASRQLLSKRGASERAEPFRRKTIYQTRRFENCVNWKKARWNRFLLMAGFISVSGVRKNMIRAAEFEHGTRINYVITYVIVIRKVHLWNVGENPICTTVTLDTNFPLQTTLSQLHRSYMLGYVSSVA